MRGRVTELKAKAREMRDERSRGDRGARGDRASQEVSLIESRSSKLLKRKLLKKEPSCTSFTLSPFN